MEGLILLAAVALPIAAGALLPVLRFKGRAARDAYILGMTLLTSALAAVAVLHGFPKLSLIQFNERLAFDLHLDGLGRVFAGLIATLWPLTTLYALGFMRGDKRENAFFSFFLISYGITLGIAMSANLLTLYIFYEMLSLSTLPLVMHKGNPAAISAGLKYLYYSLGGAAFAFIGLVYLVYFGGTTDFVPGGLFQGVATEHTAQLRLGYLLCFLGFSVKAAVFPVHGWLPSASVAPTPVTALLHAVAVVKSGVFAILRVTYFSFGALVIQGSYAQYIPLALTCFTIVFGCSMALKEKHLKRQLAYSTVSNLSYILFGALLLTGPGLTAGLMHLVFHALMKITLFLVAGVFNERAGVHQISELHGIGRDWPALSLAFALSSLAMTGIPPLIGFLSKWALAQAAVLTGGLLPYLGLAALLVSAVLTGIYLLVPSVFMFSGRRLGTAPPLMPVETEMRASVMALAALVLAAMFFSQPLIDFLSRAVTGTV